MRAIEIFESDKPKQPYDVGDVVLNTPHGAWRVMDPTQVNPNHYGISTPDYAVGKTKYLKYFGLENSQHGNLMVITQDYPHLADPSAEKETYIMFPVRSVTPVDDTYDLTYLNQTLAPLLVKLNQPFPANKYFAQNPDGTLFKLSEKAPLIKVGEFREDVIYKLAHASDWHYYAPIYSTYKIPSEFQKDDHDIYVILSPDKSFCRAVMIAQGSELVYLKYLWHIDDPELGKILKHLGITHSQVSDYIIDKRLYVANSQVLPSWKLMLKHKVATLPDGTSVYELDSQGKSIVPVWNYGKTWSTADRILMAEVQPNDRHLFYAIKKGKILGKGPMVSHLKDMVVKYEKILADVPELGLAGAKGITIKPNSAFHKMLKYVEQNPGANRTQVFVRGLGRASAMGAGDINSISSLDGLAVKAGLLDVYDPKYPGTYHYELTTSGHMILGILNNGTPVPVGDLLDEK